MAKKKRQAARTATRTLGKTASWPVALILAIGIGLYLDTLRYEFVFDDLALITQNPQVNQLRWGEILGGSGYRPARTLTYAFNYALGGEEPAGYHLFNIVLHALNGVLLYLLFVRWKTATLPAALGALIFVVHPVQTEAVAYVSGRKDLLATFFILAGLMAYTRYRREGGAGRLIVTFGLFGLGVLSKEVAIVFPAILMAADALILHGSNERPALFTGLIRAIRRVPWIHGGSIALAALGLFYAVFIMGASRKVGYWGGGLETHLGTSFKLFTHYLKLAVWPNPLIADYTGEVFPISQGLSEPSTLLAIAASVLFVVGVFWVAPRSSRGAMGLIWFASALVPVLHLIPFHEIAADRFLYLPLAGFALATSVLVERLVNAPNPNRHKAVWATASAVVLILGGLTYRRIPVWENGQTLWAATYEAAPGSYRANANMGRYLWDLGNSESDRLKGVELTRRAIELNPKDAVAVANLGGMLFNQARAAFNQGDHDGATRLVQTAEQHLSKARTIDPSSASVLSNLGSCHRLMAQIWEARGDPQATLGHRFEAQEFYKAALKADRRRETQAVWYNFALLYEDLKQWAPAVDSLEKYLKAFPAHAGGHYHMGLNLLLLNRSAEAVEYLEKASRLRPNDLTTLSMLGKAYEAEERFDDAINLLKTLQISQPGNHLVTFNLGQVHYKKGDLEAAIGYLEQVVDASADAELVATARKHIETIRRQMQTTPGTAKNVSG